MATNEEITAEKAKISSTAHEILRQLGGGRFTEVTGLYTSLRG